MRLEQLQVGAMVHGLAKKGAATIKAVTFHGDQGAAVIFQDRDGTFGNRLLLRGDEAALEFAVASRPWAFDADVTVEVQVRVPDGVKENVVRTVSENAKTLGFTASHFERED